MPKVGGRRKKTRTHKENNEADQEEQLVMGNTPRLFIFKRGQIRNQLKQTVMDMREVFYPNSAMKLKETDKTRIKDYIKAAGMFQITHMMIFTSTDKHSYVRLIKNPEGPTITFKVVSYCNAADVINSQRKKKTFSRTFAAPLIILNGFNKEISNDKVINPPSQSHYQLVSKMLQSMFPPLNLKKASIKSVQRCVLFTYDDENDTITMRHFRIQLQQSLGNKCMKKLLKQHKCPNLGNYYTFGDYLNKYLASGYVSESDADELPNANIDIEGKNNQNQPQKKQFAVRLYEIGPRLKLRLYKIEENLLKGNVVYNRLVQKKGEEIEAQRQLIKTKQLEKQKRKDDMQKILQNKKLEENLKNKKKFQDEEIDQPKNKKQQQLLSINKQQSIDLEEFKGSDNEDNDIDEWNSDEDRNFGFKYNQEDEEQQSQELDLEEQDFENAQQNQEEDEEEDEEEEVQNEDTQDKDLKLNEEEVDEFGNEEEE